MSIQCGRYHGRSNFWFLEVSEERMLCFLLRMTGDHLAMYLRTLKQRDKTIDFRQTRQRYRSMNGVAFHVRQNT